nr:DUF4388 domain-containing protein [uncultured Actinoplanes sp.]
MIPGSPATATLRSLLSELGEAGRTGALHVGGRPGGVLYLVAGRIAYAETPACPGIGERLVASGRVSAPAWAGVVASGRSGCRVGRLLLRHGLIGQHELALRVTTTICDATHELLRSDDAPVRFAEGERHWLGAVAGVELRGFFAARRRPADHDAHRVRLVAAPSPQDGPR